jgi:TetR/AcrR family transcriptional regulator
MSTRLDNELIPMKKTKQAPTVDSETKILMAAERVFAEKGLKGARVKEIAALSGVNPALINYYFGGKENLYRTVIENFFVRVERLAVSVMEQEEDVIAKLRALIEFGIDLLGENEYVSRIFVREFVDSGPYSEMLIKTYLRRIFATARKLVPPETERGRENESKIMHFIFSALGSMVLFYISGPVIKDIWKRDVFTKKMIEERKREVINLIFNGIGKQFESE